jgi:predicted ATPase/class 3 adenylate cyclase
LPTGVVTLVFTDIEGSTRLLRQLGPRYAELLSVHNQICRSAFLSRGGTVIRSEGDSYFCSFEDPTQAVAACLNAQLRLRRFGWPEGAEFRVRMGLHTGPVERGGEDYIGLAVHQAARVSDAAHGGQIIFSDATRQMLAEQLPDDLSFTTLGAYRLKDFQEPTLLYQVAHPELPVEFPALRAAPAAAHNVPEQATLFVGRQTALSELADLVREHRLVSVLGAGGVGKTRLAAEVVPLVVADFTDGVWMVELAKLRGGQAVADEIAAVLGVRAEAERSIEAMLADALASKQLLLLLDNCEHVLEDLASLVEGLLGACPGLHVLATSREPLALPGERRYPLAPLSVPAVGAAGDLSGSEAVALFIDRAKVVAPHFDLGRDREAVIEICRRLDGLPLAIELAAARAAAIPPVRMAARLDRRFSVLRNSYRGRLPHHETLRASIEWSFELLEPEERILLARLSVFHGEFELEAAEGICAGDPIEVDDVLELLGRLIEKSLVQTAEDRYLMLESIREFAREQVDDEEVRELIDAHLRYYTDFVEEVVEQSDGPRQREVYDRLDADLPNIRAAVERALERSDPAALRLSAALGQYGFIRNRLGEVAHWCIDAAAIPDAPPDLRARALNQAGFAVVLMGSPDGGQALVDDGLELARQADDQTLLAETLLMAADLRLETGRETEVVPLAEEAVTLVRRMGDDCLLGRALVISARAKVRSAGPQETAERLSEALVVFRRVGDRRGVARVLLTRAYLWLEAGSLDAAADDAAQCYTISCELQHTIGGAMARLVSVWVAVERGQLEDARSLLEDCLDTARKSGYHSLLIYCVAADAALSASEGDDRAAARLLGAIGPADAPLGGEGDRAIRVRLDTLRAALGDRLGDELPGLLDEGARRTLEDLAAA